MSEIRKELEKIAGIEIGKDEKYSKYLIRIADTVDQVIGSDEEYWDSLSKGAKRWMEDCVTIFNEIEKTEDKLEDCILPDFLDKKEIVVEPEVAKKEIIVETVKVNEVPKEIKKRGRKKKEKTERITTKKSTVTQRTRELICSHTSWEKQKIRDQLLLEGFNPSEKGIRAEYDSVHRILKILRKQGVKI